METFPQEPGGWGKLSSPGACRGADLWEEGEVSEGAETLSAASGPQAIDGSGLGLAGCLAPFGTADTLKGRLNKCLMNSAQ